MKRSPKFWVAAALVLCLVSSVGASLFQTDFGAVEYHDMTFVTASGHELDALLLVPKTATAASPAPGIVVSHGWYNNREMQDLNYVEYARRGYVVLAISMYGHGDSEAIPSGSWWDDENNANGLYDGVKYLTTLPFVDSGRIGVTGHSNGALACREAVLQDSDGLISAALLVSNDALYKNDSGAFYNMFGDRDAAIVACQYDEFFHRVDGSAPRDFLKQSTAQSFLHFGADPAGLESRQAGVFYESDGAIRAIFNPAISHPWAHFSADVVAFSLEFFDKALGAPAGIPYTSQIWQFKAAFNALGLVGFFLFLPACALAMLELPCFAPLKTAAPVLPWPMPEPAEHKRRVRSQLWSALFSIPAYFIAFVIGFLVAIPLWPQGASRVIGLWSLLCGLWTLVSMKRSMKKNPVDKVQRGITLSRASLGRSIGLALAVVAAAFGLVFLSDYFFLTDFRLWCFATVRAFDSAQWGMVLRYLPFWLFYYIVVSVSNNCLGCTSADGSDRKAVLSQMFFIWLGPQIMVMVQYIKFFVTGYMVLDPITGIMGIWLFPILLILPLSVVISRVIYRATKNPYIGGIIMGTVACILQVTNTLVG